MSYPDPSNTLLVRMQDQLSEFVGVPEAAEAMFQSLCIKWSDPEKRERACRELLEAHGVDPDATAAPAKEPAPKAAPKATDTGAVAPRPTKGGFAKVYTAVIDELMPVMPGPVFRAYVYGCRLADDTDSTFWIAYDTMASKIGCQSRQSGKVALRLLCKAGVFRRLKRGGPHRATTYQLVPIRDLDFGRARQVFEAYLRADRERPRGRAKGTESVPHGDGIRTAGGDGIHTPTQKSTQGPSAAVERRALSAGSSMANNMVTNTSAALPATPPGRSPIIGDQGCKGPQGRLAGAARPGSRLLEGVR